jgi:hypothetical protein
MGWQDAWTAVVDDEAASGRDVQDMATVRLPGTTR